MNVVNQKNVVMDKCNDCKSIEDECPEIGGPAVDEESKDCCEQISTDCVLASEQSTVFEYGKGATLTSILRKITTFFKNLSNTVNGLPQNIEGNDDFNGIPLFSYNIVSNQGAPIVVSLPMFMTGLYCFSYEVTPGNFDTFTVDSCMGNFTLYNSSSIQIIDQAIIDDLISRIQNCETTNIPCVP